MEVKNVLPGKKCCLAEFFKAAILPRKNCCKAKIAAPQKLLQNSECRPAKILRSHLQSENICFAAIKNSRRNFLMSLICPSP
ncbi:MAG: hypothetical protein IJH93_03550 [Lachnospiraceae bacterium]|nr:hypothetical protein [Lachnospiraceae bacterium]